MVSHKVKKVFYWVPRVFAILYLLFLSLFSLDVFSEGQGPLKLITAFLIHNIPSICLIIILYIAWQNEKNGGLLFLVAGMFFYFFFYSQMAKTSFGWWNLLFIVLPVFIIGLLFLFSHHHHKKHGKKSPDFLKNNDFLKR